MKTPDWLYAVERGRLEACQAQVVGIRDGPGLPEDAADQYSLAYSFNLSSQSAIKSL